MYYCYTIRLTFIFNAIKIANPLVCHECTEELPTILKTFKGTIIDQLSTFGIGNETDAALGKINLNHFCKNLEDLGKPKTCDSGSLCLEFGIKFGKGIFKKEKAFRNCMPGSSWFQDMSGQCKKFSKFGLSV